MRVVALEEHMFPRALIDAEGLDLGLRAGRKIPDLDDVGEGRLRMMDEAGIDVQVLSALSYVVQSLEALRALPVHRSLNDTLAEAAGRHPDRFRAFAALPMTDPAAAAEEFRRCVEELGFVGAMIHGQTNGVFLDHPSMLPVLETAVRLDVPIYLHPAPPPATIEEVYYADLPAEAAACLSTSGWGWHSECGMHVLRMVANGVFERLPALKIVIGHMGEGLPFHLDRVEAMLTPVLPGRSLTVAETLRRNLWITTSGYNSDTPLLCALAAFGDDRIMFSVDHPFARSAPATAHLRSAPLTDEVRELIAHGTADSLLRL